MIREDRKKGTPRKNIITFCAAILCILILGLLCFPQNASAVFDGTGAIRYSQFASKNRVEDSTIFIGTYLIHLDAYTEELKEKADASATQSGQSSIYYKSELANGAWYDISSAASVKDITEEGIAIEEKELGELWVTHYAGSDGILRDARTGNPVNPFDNPDPYNLYELKELESLRLQYENYLTEMVNTTMSEDEVLAYYYLHTWSFFSTNVRNDRTSEMDRNLALLQSCYETLKAQKDDENAEIVMRIMGQVDATRRAEVFRQLSEGDLSLLNNLLGIYNGSQFKTDAEDEDKAQFVPNVSMLDSLGDSMINSQNSFISYSAKSLAESGETILQEMQTKEVDRVLGLAENGVTPDFTNSLTTLAHLYHIEDSIIKNSKEELAVLEQALLPLADQLYVNRLQEGMSSKYRSFVSKGYSRAASEEVLNEQKAEVDNARLELQFFIKAAIERMEPEESLRYVYDRINIADSLYDQIPEDDFLTKARETLDTHIIWLQQMAEEIVNKNESLRSLLDSLISKRAELLRQRNNALDNNDLAGAAKYDALIALVDKDIEKEQKNQSAVLGEDTASAADKIHALNNLKNLSEGLIKGYQDDVSQAYADGNGAGAESSLNALANMGALDALNALKNKLGDNAAASREIDNALAKAKDVVNSGNGLVDNQGMGAGYGTETGDGIGMGDGTDDETGMGDGMTTGAESGMGDGIGNGAGGKNSMNLTAQELLDMIRAALGSDFDSLNAKGKVVAAVAVKWLGEEGNYQAKGLALDLINQCAKEQNPYVYLKFEGDPVVKYLSLQALHKKDGYRYVYSDSGKEATLTRGTDIYRFKVGSTNVKISKDESDEMKLPAQFQNDVYITESASKQYFEYSAEYFTDTRNAACMSSQMMAQAKDLLNTFKGGDGN